MNIKKTAHNARVLGICFITILVIGGCRIPSITQSTPTPQFFRFSYSEDQPFHLGFDYPSSWRVSDSKGTYTNYRVLSFQDALIPTPDLRQKLRPTSDAYVAISFEPASQMAVDDDVDQTIRTREKSAEYTLLEDYKVTIDGTPARVTEYRISSTPLGYPRTMYEKQWHFARGDQLYVITFTIAEDERHGEFEKNFEGMMDSLVILP